MCILPYSCRKILEMLFTLMNLCEPLGSRHVRASTVVESEFVFVGDSAVVAFGDLDWATGDARAGEYPSGLAIKRNLIHEIGVWGKQVMYQSDLLSPSF